MNLLLLAPGETTLVRSDSRFQHITRVLKLSVGDSLRAGIINGSYATGVIETLDHASLSLSLTLGEEPPPLAPVELLLGHPRPIVLRRLLKDLASLGLSTIRVAPTELGEKSYRSSTIWNDPSRFLLDGAAQGGTTRLPALSCERSLSKAITSLTSETRSRIVLHTDAADRAGRTHDRKSGRRESQGLTAALSTVKAPITVAIGSERGWTPNELEQLEAAGFLAAHLGPAILRTEAAALIAVWSAIESQG